MGPIQSQENNPIRLLSNPFLKAFRKFQLTLSPQQNLLFGFITYTLVGWGLLCLPWAQKISVGALDHLFIATSAISTTGLVTVSVVDSYSWFGQLIVLLLIQVGGVGYMTFTSFLLLSSKSKLTHWHHRVLKTEFTIPAGLELKDFLKSVIVFTIVIEAIGALLFYIAFTDAGVDPSFAVWSSIFHSVSSFCTAGFGLYNDSFEQFATNPWLNAIISALSIFGSMGFIVVTDFWNRVTGKVAKITFTSKVILGVTFGLIGIGTVLIYFFETSVVQTGADRWMIAFFQAMSAMTTVGFNTVPLGPFTLVVLLVIVFLMYVGASPSGTGGGMKSTTLTALVAIMWSKIRNHKRVTFLGKAIPKERLEVATSIFMLYAFVIFLSTFLLAATDAFPLQQLLFETTSAMGTVGLSTGITGSLSALGKMNIILVMFIGRLGVITFGMAILARKKEFKSSADESDLAL